MTLVRYGQAAMIAAIITLAGNVVWAQQSEPRSSPVTPGYINYFTPVLTCCKGGECSKENCAAKDCCATGGCCKDGKCCKDGDCCCKSKKCDAKCTCCKDNKCECCKGGECGCGKSGKCSCTKETKCVCCPFMNKLAKHTAILMVMPPSLPLPGICHLEAMGMLAHPLLPPPPHVLLPPPMPPHVPPYVVTSNEANTGNVIFGYGVNSNTGVCGSFAPPCPSVVGCAITGPVTPMVVHLVRITAAPSSDQLEMCIGEGTCIHSKKLTVTIGDNEITVSRFDDRIRIRGEELKATAANICTDGKDRLILEGDVVLHYKKDGHTANVMGEHIELNLSSSAMTIQRTAEISSGYLQRPPVYVPPSSPSPLTPERVHGGIEP